MAHEISPFPLPGGPPSFGLGLVKGCLKNEAAVVTSLVDRATVQQADGQEVLQRSFHGSLPSFLAAFLRAGSVSDQEAAEIEQMLEEYRQSH